MSEFNIVVNFSISAYFAQGKRNNKVVNFLSQPAWDIKPIEYESFTTLVSGEEWAFVRGRKVRNSDSQP